MRKELLFCSQAERRPQQPANKSHGGYAEEDGAWPAPSSDLVYWPSCLQRLERCMDLDIPAVSGPASLLCFTPRSKVVALPGETQTPDPAPSASSPALPCCPSLSSPGALLFFCFQSIPPKLFNITQQRCLAGGLLCVQHPGQYSCWAMFPQPRKLAHGRVGGRAKADSSLPAHSAV